MEQEVLEVNSNMVDVKCVNSECSAYEKVKTVGYQHVGQEVYIAAPFMCGICHYNMLRVK
jgi:hypothetical protein